MALNKSIVKILSVSRYEFTDTQTKSQISGCKVTYLGDAEETKNFKGVPIVTLSGPLDIWSQIPKQLPADMEIYTRVVMKGSPKPQPVIVLEGIAPSQKAA